MLSPSTINRPIPAERVSVVTNSLSCTGSGRAVLQMEGKFEFSALGDAQLNLYTTGTVQVMGAGERTRMGRWVRYDDWNGTIRVLDGRYHAILTGDDISFTAVGVGKAWLKYTGKVSVSGRALPANESAQVVVIP